MRGMHVLLLRVFQKMAQKAGLLRYSTAPHSLSAVFFSPEMRDVHCAYVGRHHRTPSWLYRDLAMR